MTDKSGRLRLILVDVYDKPIKDRVTIKLDHRALNESVGTDDVDVSGPFIIDGLRRAPEGMYVLRLTPTSYRPYAQYVNVTGKTTTVTMKLHIRPECAEPTFPSFAQVKKRNGQLADVLDRSREVRGHPHKSGSALWTALTPLQKAAVLNMGTKAFAAPLERGRGILPLITLREVRQDRCFVNVPEALVEQVKARAGRETSSKPFKVAPKGLHPPPKTFEPHSSYKTREKYGNLQFTFFHAPARNEYAADIDIDNSAGIRHMVDVIEHKAKNLKTHPFDIHQILVEYQGLDPGYTLAPKKG